MIAKSLSFFVAGLLIGLFVATCGFALFVRSQSGQPKLVGQSTGTVLKLAHSLDQNHPVHAAMEFMAKSLAEKSGDTMELQVFPNGQLGSETECIEQLQHGALAMTKTSTAPLESFVPEMAIFGVPYVFRDESHYWRVLEGEIGRGLLVSGQSFGLRGLCYYDAGSRNFYARRPILKPEDLQGLKIRVQESKTAMDMVQALGGSPTPIPWGELYTALQQNMVDGAENNPPSFFTNRHFEVCKHLSMDEHTLVPDILIISQHTWERLTPVQQVWLQEAADESSRFERNLWRQKTEEALQAVQREGVTIHYPEKAAFVSMVGPMHRSYEGTPVGDLLKAIREVE